MNNALVKEYFRAIKEIRPIAFVMENVSMLESDTHRFYDSHNDHDEIEALRTQGYAIPTRDDEIFISKDNFIGFDMLDIAMHIETVESIILPNELYVLIRVLNKNKNNKKRLPNFLQKNKNQLIKQIDKYIEMEDNQDSHKIRICEMLQIIKAVLPEAEALRECAELSSLVELQKNLISIREIYQNRLIGDYKKDTDNNVVFATKSYSVIDYINAILGNQYIQKGATLNAEWFGVPQERRRFWDEIKTFATKEDRKRDEGTNSVHRSFYQQCFILSQQDKEVVEKLTWRQWQDLLDRVSNREDKRIFEWIRNKSEKIREDDWREFEKGLHLYLKSKDTSVFSDQELFEIYNSIYAMGVYWRIAFAQFSKDFPKSAKIKTKARRSKKYQETCFKLKKELKRPLDDGIFEKSFELAMV